jgi:proteasome component ECM29
LSSFSCVKELCHKIQNSDDSDTWPEATDSLVQEVCPIVCVALYPASAFAVFLLLPLMDLFSLYFQLFHLVSAKVVDSIRLVKIAQVTFCIPSPN